MVVWRRKTARGFIPAVLMLSMLTVIYFHNYSALGLTGNPNYLDIPYSRNDSKRKHFSLTQEVTVSPGFPKSKAPRYFGTTNLKTRSMWNLTVLELDHTCPIILSGKHQRSGLGHAFMSFNALVAMASFYGVTLNASFPEQLTHSVDCGKVAKFFRGDIFRPPFQNLNCHQKLYIDSRSLPGAIVKARQICRSGTVCISLTQEVPPAEVLMDVQSYREGFKVPAEYVEELIREPGYETDLFRVAIHIRRGDIVGRSRWATRWISNQAYAEFIPKLISRIQTELSVAVILFVEGARSVNDVPDANGVNRTDFSTVHDTVILGPREMHLALTAMCTSDILVTSLSGYSHFVALMCDKPHVLALPFWHTYVGIPNVLTELQYAQDANQTITRIDLPPSFHYYPK